MGLISSLGLGGGVKSPDTQSTGFNKWEKQGNISFGKAINKAGMPYHNSKKVRDFMEAKFAGGKSLSHDQIIKEVKKEFGYNLGKRVKRALAPNMKQELQKPNLHEQVEIKKEAEITKENYRGRRGDAPPRFEVEVRHLRVYIDKVLFLCKEIKKLQKKLDSKKG